MALFVLSHGSFLMCAAAHTRVHFFCLSKRNEPKKKTPDDLPLADARGSLRFSPFPARVNSRSTTAQTCTRFFPETAAMLGGVNGTGCNDSATERPVPLVQPSTAGQNREKRGLSEPIADRDKADRSLLVAACGAQRARVMEGPRQFRSAGFDRGAQGSRSEAQTKPWGALSFAFFSLGKQRKEGLAR